MTAKFKCFLAGAVLAGAFAAPASAGGEYDAIGIKDYTAGVPVPAPVPIPVYGPEWYARIDLGGSWIAGGTIEETGTPLEMREPGDLTPTVFGGIGVGRYVTSSIRAEITFDMSNDVDISHDGVSTYTDTRTALGPTSDPLGNTVTSYDTKFYDVERTEQVRLSQNYALLSFYYDFKNASAFTPYIGAGLGITYRVLKRKATERAECTDTTNSNVLIDADYGPSFCLDSEDLPNTYTTTTTTKTNQWDIAAAAMAGFSYNITDDIAWDNGYRFIWQGGSIRQSSSSVSGTSIVELSDVIQHQFRTGLRFNIN